VLEDVELIESGEERGELEADGVVSDEHEIVQRGSLVEYAIGELELHLPLQLGEEGGDGLEEEGLDLRLLALDDTVGDDDVVGLAELLELLGEDLILRAVLVEETEEVIGRVVLQVLEELLQERVINRVLLKPLSGIGIARWQLLKGFAVIVK
jgi:hypothetical protein